MKSLQACACMRACEWSAAVDGSRECPAFPTALCVPRSEETASDVLVVVAGLGSIKTMEPLREFIEV